MIPIVDDSYAEGIESFTITLTNPNGATLGAPASATINISDNETANGTNPIDQAGFFVRQHYLDFLNREPDQDTDYTGYEFWRTKLNQFNGNFQNAEMVKAFINSTEYRQRFGP